MFLSDLLPGQAIAYNVRAGRYTRNGRFISFTEIEQLQEAEKKELRGKLQRLTQRMIDREISLSEWENEFAELLKSSHIRMTILAYGGAEQARLDPAITAGLTSAAVAGVGTAAAVGAVAVTGAVAAAGIAGLGSAALLGLGAYSVAAQILKAEYELLHKFAQQLRDEQVSSKQAIARSKAYAGSVTQTFYGAYHVSRSELNYDVAERTLDLNADHCNDCPKYVTNGFVPIEQVVPKGQGCQCRGNCRCRIRYGRIINGNLVTN